MSQTNDGAADAIVCRFQAIHDILLIGNVRSDEGKEPFLLSCKVEKQFFAQILQKLDEGSSVTRGSTG